MERYKVISSEIRERSGKRRYSSTYYPRIPPKTSDLYIYATTGDRLDLLADEYYGDVTLWVILGSENNIFNGTLNITPGTRLRIPYPLTDVEIERLVEEQDLNS